MNAPPLINAKSAAIHGQGSESSTGSIEADAASEPSATAGCGAVPVVTSSGSEGVTGRASAGRLEAAACRSVGACKRGDGPDERSAAVDGAAAASAGTASPLRGVADAVFAGWAGVAAAGLSAGRVTRPCRLKSRSCEGPMVSADGGGAAVTSTGASVFCAAAGIARASATAAPRPPNAFDTIRRSAVILPRPAVAG